MCLFFSLNFHGEIMINSFSFYLFAEFLFQFQQHFFTNGMLQYLRKPGLIWTAWFTKILLFPLHFKGSRQSNQRFWTWSLFLRLKTWLKVRKMLSTNCSWNSNMTNYFCHLVLSITLRWTTQIWLHKGNIFFSLLFSRTPSSSLEK